jgi:hypothetical protein
LISTPVAHPFGVLFYRHFLIGLAGAGNALAIGCHKADKQAVALVRKLLQDAAS